MYSERGRYVINTYIRECDSTLYVRLTGIVWDLIQKSTGMDTALLIIFSLGMSRASDNTKEENTVNPLRFLSCRSMTF